MSRYPLRLHRLVDVPAIAAAVGVSERTVRRWCALGRLPGAWQPSGRAGSWYVPMYALVEAGLMPDVAEMAEMAEMAEDEHPARDPAMVRV